MALPLHEGLEDRLFGAWGDAASKGTCIKGGRKWYWLDPLGHTEGHEAREDPPSYVSFPITVGEASQLRCCRVTAGDSLPRLARGLLLAHGPPGAPGESTHYQKAPGGAASPHALTVG